jgi:chitinase
MKEKQLGGVMFWSLDSDDFKGTFCNQGVYPLINSVLDTLKNKDIEYEDFLNIPLVNIDEPSTKGPIKGLSEEEKATLCANGDGFYADYESKCQQYRRCLFVNTDNSNVQYSTCPDGLLFDENLNVCNHAALVKCKPKKIKTKTTTKNPKNECESG